jgi:hypothetical protein
MFLQSQKTWYRNSEDRNMTLHRIENLEKIRYSKV